MEKAPKILVLVGSPRRNGNSATLAESVKLGAEKAGAAASLCFVDDYISHFLKDCRTCRNEQGECTINDDFEKLFFEEFLAADGVVFCSPVYWYGMSGQMKTFFDRTFCYYAASYADSEKVIEKMKNKRIGLVLASEETYPGASLGIVHQIQEYSRYTHSEFVGVVRGIANSRGEVKKDPSNPLYVAEQLGVNLLKQKFSDYHIDTERPSRTWE